MSIPQTPTRKTDPTNLAPELKNTPLGHGSSTHASSDGFHDLYQRTVHPWLFADISKHKQTTFDRMIAWMLHFSLPTELRDSVNPYRLFDQCLNKVLPICNDQDLLNHLQSYCEVEGGETARYAPFTNACNRALSLLEDVDVPHLGKGSPFKILFQRNDPNVLDGVHGNLKSKRKPDIIITSLACARRIWGEGRNIRWNTAISHCHEKPVDLQWHDVLCSWEFKRTKKVISLPSRKYGTKLCRNISCVNDVGTMDPPTKPDVPSPKPNPDQPLRTEEPPLVQLASYAAEMLCRAPAVNHCMNILVVDDVAWLWWYDRQGAIQCTGIDFLDDLPRFLVLLLVLQRFSTMDLWGFNPELDPVVVQYHSGKLPLNQTGNVSQEPFDLEIPVEGGKFKVNLDPKEKEYSRHTLVGRGTRVFQGSEGILFRDPANPEVLMNEKARHAAIKIYWPDSSRPSEQTVVQKAREAAEKIDPGLLDNLPEIYGACTLSKYETGRIRKFLELWDLDSETQERVYHSRTLNITISEWLLPLWKLPPYNFMLAWYDIVRCHFAMWIAGVKHCDPSEGNMLYREKGNKNHGVLNDWDLSSVEGLSDHKGLERTGTVPFMSLELLNRKFWRGRIRREYRHDLESFIWMLPWAVFCYEDCQRKEPPDPVRLWQTGNYEQCREKKVDFTGKMAEFIEEQRIPPQWMKIWPVVRDLMYRVHEDYHSGVKQRGQGIPQEDNTPVEVYVNLLQFIRETMDTGSIKPNDIPFPDDYLMNIPQLPNGADTETPVRGRAQAQFGGGDRGAGSTEANLDSERSTSGSRRSARIKADEEKKRQEAEKEKKRQEAEEERKHREKEERKRQAAETKKRGKK
ncbi:unnamed protein product [Somion occarium]|uniref:Fungal-type protein kinase domain-containing protein n=1 Tax=Somion occarium TaxID=3059160 RepID=A0ABP1E765_9APHY